MPIDPQNNLQSQEHPQQFNKYLTKFSGHNSGTHLLYPIKIAVSYTHLDVYKRQVVKWLELAKGVAENTAQANALALLISYYKTGDLQTWDDYNVAWTAATEGNIDYINSLIEVYKDPFGYRGSYDSIV